MVNADVPHSACHNVVKLLGIFFLSLSVSEKLPVVFPK